MAETDTQELYAATGYACCLRVQPIKPSFGGLPVRDLCNSSRRHTITMVHAARDELFAGEVLSARGVLLGGIYQTARLSYSSIIS